MYSMHYANSMYNSRRRNVESYLQRLKVGLQTFIVAVDAVGSVESTL